MQNFCQVFFPLHCHTYAKVSQELELLNNFDSHESEVEIAMLPFDATEPAEANEEGVNDANPFCQYLFYINFGLCKEARDTATTFPCIAVGYLVQDKIPLLFHML